MSRGSGPNSGAGSASVEGAEPDEIRRLERIARASWPAATEVELDGWLLGISGRYTRRANSVSPVGDGAWPLAQRVEQVEARYSARRLPTVFKMTKASEPEGLDAFLAARDYGRHSETLVMTIRKLAPSSDASSQIFNGGNGNGNGNGGGDGNGEGRATGKNVTGQIDARPSAAWVEASCSLSGVADETRTDYRSILDRLESGPCDSAFATLRAEGEPCSVALAVVSEDVVSFYQVATHPDFRGRRAAQALIESLLERARGQGATSAMLSVEAENTSARRLYERLGFRERYRYWYRER
ncbi:MAG: GNAT family N-acetyltransferase [Myxococcota bacterium]